MTPKELYDTCTQAIKDAGSEETEVYLKQTIPLKKAERLGERMRLFGSFGPLGEVLKGNPTEDPKQVAIIGLWKAKEVMKCLENLGYDPQTGTLREN